MKRILSQFALLVRNYDEAIDYYCGCLGFSLVEDTDMGGGKRWVVVRPSEASGGANILLAQVKNAEELVAVGNQSGGRVFLFMETDDFWRDYKAYLAKGVDFTEEPREEFYGTVVVFRDLYGNKWDLICRK
jgi:Lactoylglutathione lyase and related lyases